MQISATVFVLTAALAGVASADPDAPTAAASQYVDVAGTAGVQYSVIGIGLAAELGVRLGHSAFWLHGDAAAGQGDAIYYANSSGSFQQLRAGAEARTCDQHTACGFVGLDLGVEHAHWAGYEETLSGYVPSNAPWMVGDVTQPVIVPRLGGDFGGPRVRMRTSVEWPVSRDGLVGIEGSLAILVQY